MKQIKLKSYLKNPEGRYLVYLGNGTIHEFPSKKKAERFLSKTNIFLTEQLYDLNKLYAEVHYLYRMNWCFYANDKNPMSVASERLAFKNREIRQFFSQLSSMDNPFDRAVTQSSRNAGNYYAFGALKQVVEILISVCKSLTQLTEKKSHAPTNYELTSLLKRILDAEARIQGYGQLKAIGRFDAHNAPNPDNQIRINYGT